MTDQPRITTASAFPDQATIYLPEYAFWDTQAGACEVGVPVELLPGLRDAIDAHHFAHASGRSEATPASGDTVRLPAHSTVTVAIRAPTEDDADRWANTIRDLVTAEHGHHMRLDITVSGRETGSADGLREQYLAALVAWLDEPDEGRGWGDLAAEAADAVLAVRDRRMEQLAEDAQRYDEAIGELNKMNTNLDRQAARAEAAIARVRALAADMRTWCSPHGIAVDYAQRIDDALDGQDGQ